jgi:hypothetical protein
VKAVAKRRKRKADSYNDSDYNPSATEVISEHNPSMDVDSGDEDEEINMSMYKGPKKNWKSEQYIKEHSVDMPMHLRMVSLSLTFILRCSRMPSLMCFLITKFPNTSILNGILLVDFRS